MMHRRRGVLAALFLSGMIAGSSALSSAADSTELAPGESVLPDGLTTQVHKATASGAVALEVWIRCPANGWSSSQPGIARLTALAAVGAKSGGTSLRDAVRVAGGQLSVSIFQTATEIAILAPYSAAPILQDELMRRVFHPLIDAAALSDAKTRLAEEISSDAERAGAKVAWGRCWEGGGAPAFWPWTQALRDTLPQANSDEPEAQFRFFEAVTQTLRSEAAAQPLLLVLDDLQAADEASILLLEFVATELPEMAALVVALGRPETVRLDELERHATRTVRL